MSAVDVLRPVLAAFPAASGPVAAEPLGAGHIHRTWRVTCEDGGRRRRLVLQRLNTAVFPDVAALMGNAVRIQAHLAARSEGAARDRLTAPGWLPAVDGRAWAEVAGGCWRLAPFVERSRTPARPVDVRGAETVGRAYGSFLRLVSDLGPETLAEVIPDFHFAPRHYAALDRALEEDPLHRVRGAGPEIDAVLRRRAETCARGTAWRDGALPRRVVHNDAKADNVLLDADGGAVLAVVDLDTVMPGAAPHDFGDMVRSLAGGTAEDAPDAGRGRARAEIVTALARGFLAGTDGLLVAAEREALIAAALDIAVEQAVRFLADHLAGDRYYPAASADHNLRRCRTQLILAASLEEQRSDLERRLARL